jgi:methenyltetrahydrofolate cyclohydrolase
VTPLTPDAGSLTVAALLERFAADSPDAGGGAAAALTAATAAALVTMVAGITARRGGSATPGAPAALPEIAQGAAALRDRLLTLIDEDIAAYRRVVAARRGDAAGRDEAVRRELLHAAEPPLAVARAAVALLEHCHALVSRARASTLADLATAAALARAALDSAAFTARVNLASLGEPATSAVGAVERLLARGAALHDGVVGGVTPRAVGGA